METTTYTFTKKLRPGKRDDFAEGKEIKPGTSYYLKSAYTDKFEGPYILWPNSDLKLFAVYMQHDMVWVEAEDEDSDAE